MTFWPIREGPGAEPELDAIVHEVIRKNPRGLHLADVARKVREVYPQNETFALLTGIVELDQIVASLCRLAVRGYIYRIGTERQPVSDYGQGFANEVPPFGPRSFQFEKWPRWKPVNLLVVIAKAAGGDEPFRTKWNPPPIPQFVKLCRWLFREPRRQDFP